MEFILLKEAFTICKVTDYSLIDWNSPYVFIAKTDEENSLVCPSTQVPSNTLQREDEWRGFRIQGMLDFSMVGVLAKITTLLANQEISVFAISTYNTDYIFVKEIHLEKARNVLLKQHYHFKEA